MEPLLFIEVLSHSREFRTKFPKLLGVLIALCKLGGIRLLAIRVVPASYESHLLNYDKMANSTQIKCQMLY